SFVLLPEERCGELLASLGSVGLVRVRGKRPGVLCDALAVPECCTALVRSIAEGRTHQTGAGELQAVPLPRLAELAQPAEGEGPPVIRQSERGTFSVRFGDRLILKRFRRLDEGISPTVEIGRYLTEQQQFAGIVPVAGYLEYRSP